MNIDHLAIWCDDIERMRDFYTQYFQCTSNNKYYNPNKKFSSYFLTFAQSQCKIELMNRPDITEAPTHKAFSKGIAHFDIQVESKQQVETLIKQLRADQYTIASEPRTTGDGYYEAAILDPEGNYIEISAPKD